MIYKLFILSISILTVALAGMAVVGIYGVGFNTIVDLSEKNLITTNTSQTPQHVYERYQEELNNNKVINGGYLIAFVNAVLVLYIVWVVKEVIKIGRKTNIQISDIMGSHLFLLYISIYLSYILIEYILSVFYYQFILVLFSHITSQIFMMYIIIKYYPMVMLLMYVLAWGAHQTRRLY